MLAWKLKWALSDDRWDFHVIMGRASARARGEFCIVHNRKVAMLARTL